MKSNINLHEADFEKILILENQRNNETLMTWRSYARQSEAEPLNYDEKDSLSQFAMIIGSSEPFCALILSIMKAICSITLYRSSMIFQLSMPLFALILTDVPSAYAVTLRRSSSVICQQHLPSLYTDPKLQLRCALNTCSKNLILSYLDIFFDPFL